MDDDEAERTLLIVREVSVYKPPPRPGVAGYRCQDWPKESFIFSGRLRVRAAGALCVVLLEAPTTGALFAQCPVSNERPELSVEPVTDSSRYFVVRADDGNGRHAYLGVGFKERTDAFDFNVAIQDHVRGARGEAAVAEALEAPPSGVDYALKAGQTITIALRAGGGGSGARPREAAAVGDGGLGALQPPPALAAPPGAGGGARRRAATAATPQADALASGGGSTAAAADPFGSGGATGGAADGFGFDGGGGHGGFGDGGFPGSDHGASAQAGWTTFG
jgi:hypothetical protein